uniref:RPA1 related single stranded DNA binding protein, X-linked n=1 Tax=Oncorhynchus kisutch TaxID=8019 RepID=A0A8C7L7D5_ONCKI
MACCALMMPEEVQNISACSDPLTENNQNSFLHSTLEQFIAAKTRTLKIDTTDAVAVIELQRYLTEQQNVGQHPPDSYSYDVIVTDGVWQAKCILDCSLNHLIHKNIIRSGIDINITQCSFVFNERRLGQGCVCIEKIEHGSKESNVLRKIKDLDSLPMISKDGFGNIVALQSDSPLQVGRKHYLSLWNNEDPEGRLWVPDVPPSDMTLLCDLESSLGCMFRPLPLIVRVIHKSRLRYYGKPDLKIYYPYQAYFEVADQSGTMSLVLWNELCPEWYQRLNVGTVLYLQNYTLKQSYQNRSRPHIDNHRMKSFHSVEICLNPRNPTAVLTVVPAKSVPPQWGLPEVSYQFAIRSELDSLASNSACDVIGLVTFVSRVERIKSKGNTEKYWTYRWVHAVDGTSNIPFILEIFASSQPEIFNGLYPMTYLVCTQMRKCQEQDSLPYLTSSCETQIFTTGYHKGQPYVSDPKVKSFIQWTKTLKDSVMLKKTAVGGHYCFPHAPIIFTQSVADGSAQVPLVAANDLKSEMEGLHYREHKRLAIQGQIMAVYYVTLPEETLSDQVGFIDIIDFIEGATGERAVADCDRTSWESSSWPKQRQEVLEYLHPGGVYSESLSQRFRFDDKTLLLQQSNLHAARWTPEQTTDTLSPVTCKGYYKITILGINQQMAIDAAFVPVMSSGDPRSVGLTQDPHDNTLLSCLSAGFICPLADPLSQSEVALPEPGNTPGRVGQEGRILATAEELKDTHLVCILDLCHLGGEKVEVIITKVYRMTDIALV